MNFDGNKPLTIALAGNPNAGKTTLFNSLTGLNQKVANYPGVTVERKDGVWRIGEHAATLIDLPGLYSLDATSLDEIAAQVGTTKRTLHHHIGSKQDLVAACYERAFRIFLFIKDRMLEYSGSRLQALAASMDALARRSSIARSGSGGAKR